MNYLTKFGLFTFLPNVTREHLIADIIAACTVAVILIPQGMAYASLGGLPPIYGLYSATLPLIIFGCLTTSSQVAVGPVAPTAIFLANIITSHTGFHPRTPEFITCHFTLAFLSGFFQIIFGILEWGALARILSWPVMTGFTAGAAVIVGISQISDFFGLKLIQSDKSSIIQLFTSLNALGKLSFSTTIIGILSLSFLLYWRELSFFGRKLPKFTPVGLTIVLFLTFLSAIFNFHEKLGLNIVGTIPASLPAFHIPFLNFHTTLLLLPSSILISIVSFIQTVALADIFGRKIRENFSPNKEWFALGISSVLCSFFSCHAIVGSFTRSAIQAEAGARTPLTGIFSGLLLTFFLLTFVRFLSALPTVALAAIVLASTRPLINFNDFQLFFRVKRGDFALALFTVLSVIFAGISSGLLLGLFASAIVIIIRTNNVGLSIKDAILAIWKPIEIEQSPKLGILVLRVRGDLHYANVTVVTARAQKALDFYQQQYMPQSKHSDIIPTCQVIIDASKVADIDITACREISKLIENFQHVSSKFQKNGVNHLPKLFISGLASGPRRTLTIYGYPSGCDVSTTIPDEDISNTLALVIRNSTSEDIDIVNTDTIA